MNIDETQSPYIIMLKLVAAQICPNLKVMLLDFPSFIELSFFEEPDKSKNIDLIRTKLYLYKFDQIMDG